ncbi:MAG: VapE domain-containing protein, partial [bacterium]
DAVAEGWDWKAVVAWAKERVKGSEEQVKTTLVKAVAAWAKERVKVETTEPESALKPTVEVIEFQDDDAIQGTPSQTCLWEDAKFTLNKGGSPVMNQFNVTRYLDHTNAPIWWDAFTQKIRTCWTWGADYAPAWNKEARDWADNDYPALTNHLQGQAVGLTRINRTDVREGVRAYAHGYDNSRNEAQEWLNGLAWDGVPRVGGLLSTYFKADDTAYARAVGRNMMLAMVARVLHPGCKFDNLPVLIGAQGIGKSRGLQALGGCWYGDVTPTARVDDKDFYQSFPGHMLIEIPELAALKRSRVEDVKAMLSRATDTYRKPYRELHGEVARSFIFVATTNETAFLTDPTGARRFWPVTCKGPVDVDGLTQDRDRMFSEAKTLYDRAEKWWEVPEAEALAAQEAAHAEEPWGARIQGWLRGKTFVTLAEVCERALELAPKDQTPAATQRVAAHLRATGWSETRKTLDGHKTRGWSCPA